ncbi:MAG: efflux RND transporter periplasmic adaptor subunit, partial [Candidatus Neomarinimicrobiota bacterium]
MNRKKFALLPLLLLVFSLALAGCDANAKTSEEDEEELAPALPVEAQVIATGLIAAHFTGPVTLETESDAVVVSKTAGVVETIFVEEGQLVKAGDLLAKLEDDKETFRLEQAAATLSQLEGDYHRNQELFSKNLVSAEIFERSRYAYEAQLAAYKLAKLEKDYTGIRAPFDGIIAERSIKVGMMVPLNNPVFRIVDYSILKAILHVPEIELAQLSVGQQAAMTVDALPDNHFSGRLDLISPIVDPATGTVKVTVGIDNQRHTLKPGMFGRVDIMHEIHQNALLLPKEA